jgi:hypothetical protein
MADVFHVADVYFGTQNATCTGGVEFSLSHISMSVVVVPNAYAQGSATRQPVKYVITTNKIPIIKVGVAGSIALNA